MGKGRGFSAAEAFILGDDHGGVHLVQRDDLSDTWQLKRRQEAYANPQKAPNMRSKWVVHGPFGKDTAATSSKFPQNQGRALVVPYH